MIERTVLENIGFLAGFQSDCGRCGTRSRIVRSIAPRFAMGGGDEIYGGRCNSCDTVLWCQAMQNSILTRLEATPPKGVDPKQHREEIRKEFLASLPACPICGRSEHSEFVGVDVPESKLKCSNCTADLPPYRGYVRAMLNDDVYLFHESEKVAEQAQRYRLPFNQWDSLI